MSLQNLARHVQSRGRGEDKMLVHMTPGEVQGLQALAMRHGGSLSINPDTGLPEAGFLRNILPSVVGGAVGIATMNPMLGAAVGGGLGLATSGGNLSKGIMSGIGAYGFGSLGAGLAASGNATLGAAAMPAAELAGTEALAATGFTPTTAAMSPSAVSDLVSKGVLDQSAANAYGQGFSSAFQTPSTMSSIQEGFTKAAASPGAFFKQNMFPIGAAALGTLAASAPEQQYGIPAASTGQIQPYTYTQTRNPDFGKVPGAAYFNQTFTPGTAYAAKKGGIVELADGGVVERMSAMNQQSGMYPQGMITNAQYAVPTQRPASMEVIKSDYDTYVNPMTGLGKEFANGGIVALADGGVPVPRVDPIAVAPNLGRYSQPAPAVNPAVTAYNQILADRAANEYVLQAPPLTMLPSGGERATPADTSKIISQYYMSELGRKPDQPGLEYWTGQKMDTGMSLADIKKAISESPEAVARREAMAPPKQTYFDTEFYLKQNPDITRVSEYATDPFLHYQRHGFKEGRLGAEGYKGTEMLGMAPKAPTAPSTLGGYTYDQATGQFTKAPSAVAPQEDLSGFFSGALNDPAFRDYMYRQYQQSQYIGGAKAGGLMELAKGGVSDLGDYSDGGRLLKGPGDGVSDSIPAQIGARQPARLADGEFVVPARIVSELGNGSTDAGARKLYAMMDRIQKKRRKSIGKNKVAVDSKAEAVLPA